VGLSAALVAVSAAVAQLPGLDVNAGAVAPLMARWQPRVGPGTVPALVVVGACARGWVTAHAKTLSWWRLLAATWALALLWMVSLGGVDGARGLGAVLDDPTEYLTTARSVGDVGAVLRTFTSHVPLDSPDHWTVHVAGHPPGALLVFVGLDRIGLGSALAAGLAVCVVAATTPVAVAVTGRALGAERAVRTALPFLAIGPLAMWQAVSADALFAAVAAWTVACGALAASARGVRQASFAALGGVLLAACALLSYGLPLIAVVLAGAVVVGSRWPVGVTRLLGAMGLVAVGGVIALAATGFSYWQAYPVLQQRYWDGLASSRPGWYWVWANLAVLAVVLGPVVMGALAIGLPRGTHVRLRRRRRWSPSPDAVTALVVSALVVVLVADLSLMSKAEVERIWLFVMPWLVLSTAWLPPRWHRRGLVAQAVTALVLQHVLATFW
jgi:hypothetical protein